MVGAGRRGADRRPAAGTDAAGGSGAGRPTDPVVVAREICLRLLAARARSRAELATALRSRGVDDDVAATVLDRLTAVGLVDDGAFAAAFVSSARTHRGLGRQALVAELRRRGVQPDVVEVATSDLAAHDEEEMARDLVRRRLRSMDRLPEQARVRRLLAMLMRRGYPAELAIRVVREQVGAGADEGGPPPATWDGDDLGPSA
ncbi:recombination regulator RecX [Frankia sp. AiPs1]|uniref:recombination regulator RecX n=1 Tax=Frankia sp. AiPs1 TaxID=573493 RepID=UPI00204464E6|nr:recombination regulator RecX [Frankia sp. AiPs1]MCM3922171.1 recombination regulator RecX [Frankia sp. AiPs1]